MCFTPAFVVFLPFAPILGVWGGSLYVSHSMTTRWLESNFNVCVTMARWRYHALGWSTAAGVSVGLATLGTTDYFVAQRTSATILGNHDLKPKEVRREGRANDDSETKPHHLPPRPTTFHHAPSRPTTPARCGTRWRLGVSSRRRRASEWRQAPRRWATSFASTCQQ